MTETIASKFPEKNQFEKKFFNELSKQHVSIDTFDYQKISFVNQQRLVFFLESISSEEDAEALIKTLPTRLDLEAIGQGQLLFLEWLVQHSYYEELFEALPEQIDIQSINPEAGLFLQKISEAVNDFGKRELLSKVDVSAFYTASEGAYLFLQKYIVNPNFRNYFEEVPKLFHVQDCTTFATRLICNSIHEGNLEFWLPRFPDVFKFPLGDFASVCFLLVKTSPEILKEKFPKKIAQKDLLGFSDMLFNWLCSEGHSDWVLSLFEPESTLTAELAAILNRVVQSEINNREKLSPAAKIHHFLRDSLRKSTIEKVKIFLPAEMNINAISHAELGLVTNLIRYDVSNKDTVIIKGPLDVTKECNYGYAIKKYCEANPDVDLKDILPSEIKLLDIAEDEDTFLSLMEIASSPKIGGMGKAAFKKLLSAEQLPTFSSKEEQKIVLAAIPRHNFLLFSEFGLGDTLEAFDLQARDVRFETKLDTSVVIEKCGPSLLEQMQSLPIDSNGWVQKGDWYVAKLSKSGSKTRVFVKIGRKEEIETILFRNYEILGSSIAKYGIIAQRIPQFVASTNYPELGSKSKFSFVSLEEDFETSSNREVYAGPSLSTINIDLLPPQIQESIILQKKYILMNLARLEIDHGHAHDDNFNLRFLLRDDNGKKEVVFDPTVALKRAQAENLFITPIVTLRDWDETR